MKTNLRIGEVLMERNYITQEQMEQALAYQKEHREKRVGQILIELGFVTEAHPFLNYRYFISTSHSWNL